MRVSRMQRRSISACGKVTVMPISRYAILIPLVALVFASPSAGRVELRTQPGVTADDPRLAKLPAPLREQGRLILAESDDAKRADLAEALAEREPIAALDFLLALLDSDTSADVREEIVDALEEVRDDRVNPALERRVLADPDVDIALLSLDLLRARAMVPLMELVERRLKSENETGTAESRELLVREQERWTSILRGALLPTFFQVPPPVFSVAPAGRPIRVLAFGDFGDGSDAQRLVAGAMLRHHRRRPFDFAITLGDNFYPSGMESPADPRWRTDWNALYDPLKIRFYASLGNHDYNQPNSPAAEILFGRQSDSWRMPAAYYTFTAGSVQFFALDTDIISHAQLLWLSRELDRSRAMWKVVYGHHPIYSEGVHEDNNTKIDQLLPVLRDRADVYLAGHDHDMQHLKPVGRLHFFVAGSGGKLRPIEPGPRSLFAKSANGFAVLEADQQSLTITFVEANLATPYRYTLRRTVPTN
jgi:tartrate-resistant acid phosphatase type 5